MVEIQPPFSMPSAVTSNHYVSAFPLPPLADLTRARKDISRRSSEGQFYDQRQPILPPLSRQGLQTPPGEMTGMNINPLLAPHYEDLRYKSVPALKPNVASEQASASIVPNPRYASHAAPKNDYRRGSQPEGQSSTRETISGREQVKRQSNEADLTSIVSYLQIPASINDSKGSLAEFAAQITCLFWFESSFTLHFVEESAATPPPIQPLVSEAMPTMGFRKWVVSILSTTQVSQNVILLALMFIYRLKKLNPAVKGKLGSEFRLFTVALMLGNKFLDDNTYTNKTWAEVSGISVQEIHIMEVEFLSNMRYTLYASEAEWKAWHVKLGKFWKYFDNASKTPSESLLRNLGPLPSPRGLPNLPSPPASTHTSPPYLNNHNSGAPNIVSSHRLSMPPYIPSNSSSPIKPLPEITLRPTTRKRSRDQSQEIHEPCTKRYAPSIPTSTHSSAALTPCDSSSLAPSSLTTPSNGNYTNNSGPKLPMPNLTISTGKHYTERRSSPPTQLPMPSVLSRSTALPGMNRWPQNGSLPSLHQNAPPNLQPNDNISPLSERAPRQPPFTTNSSTPSPTSFNFPQSAHTPNHLSPASFPLPRSSPYKPVRHVHTLLVPPPSASMHDPPQNLGYGQMHYQPLGKPISQRRPGVLPTLQQDSWGQTHNMPVFLPQPKVSN